MNVEIGAEAVLSPEKEYINGIFVAVYNTTKNNEGGFRVAEALNFYELRSWPRLS
jgi:hypothetical protein